MDSMSKLQTLPGNGDDSVEEDAQAVQPTDRGPQAVTPAVTAAPAVPPAAVAKASEAPKPDEKDKEKGPPRKSTKRNQDQALSPTHPNNVSQPFSTPPERRPKHLITGFSRRLP